MAAAASDVMFLLGAALLESSDIGSETLTGAMIGSYAAGMITAAVVGYISIRFLLRIVRGRKMRYFGYYCFAVGILAIAGHFFLK